ncbi:MULTISPECIES: lytic transglycosylase domain-containing protein [unclassified Streptomyces]|uniref:lytic transglycosylase domain-containing protein n=1 Tax=unclassified Streptomyces TaxID=2593676 RepID=UPI00166169AB|nr:MULTISPECIES: lytic transglycosylase domain-containing protein [unclassified Streptomyces]MBD0710504.1 lytic transglycosylase [Streptomyces sp. CBMA291]MBD0713495.1 lytic transglycosylase [Streptomyces sp. CBMA370]
MSAHLGRRLRRGATSGAVVAAAVAALAASQAPETVAPPTDNAGGDRAVGAGDTLPAADEGSATGDSPYFLDLPPLNSPKAGASAVTPPVITGPAEAGIPATVLAAYQRAEQAIRATDPACHLPWQLLAGIGKVESGQAGGGKVDANGTTFQPILGPALNGNGFANISDTDGGAYDGDPVHDRAVGPMQFIPSTWATWGQDANGDGKKDPNNIYDAAQAAGLYLCANDRDLALKSDLDKAILSYNQSTEYLHTVLSWFEYYRRGTHQVPDGTGVLPVDRSDNRGKGDHPATTFPVPPVTTPPTTPPAPKPGGSSGATPPPTTPKPPVKPPVTPPTKPTMPPTAKVAKLSKVATGELTASAGSAFAKSPAVAALDASGGPVAGVSVRFEIADGTDARFTGGATTATVTTGPAGIAAAPVLRAGEKTGPFTIKATVVGRTLDAAEFSATVTARSADTLVRVGGDLLTAASGSAFEQRVQVKATGEGKATPGVVVTAEIAATGSGADAPYFKDGAGAPLRTLTVTTDENGLITLPELFAGDKPGEYVLRLTTSGGVGTEVKLTVTAPPTPDPTPSGGGSSEATPSASPSASASPSPSA